MKVEIEEMGDGLETISLCFMGEELFYTASPTMLTVSLDEDSAERIAFHLQTILMDRQLKKDLTK